ncbi:hypothetical protein QC762_0050500 [Podospora pseudocomata]|uniref:Uncharacterized protein n=1 Tax=Podospora pseudocomata TaxID=2093779 RepID=A0ABR0GI95_9PEZI|nr:hypothetical protein QC762_0050500 [Podospora pseudocomata]
MSLPPSNGHEASNMSQIQQHGYMTSQEQPVAYQGYSSRAGLPRQRERPHGPEAGKTRREAQASIGHLSRQDMTTRKRRTSLPTAPISPPAQGPLDGSHITAHDSHRGEALGALKAIKLLIAARVKELEGRVPSRRVSFAGSDGENIWHDFDNREEALAGDMRELKLVEDAMDVDKENNSCFVVPDRAPVKSREGGVEKMEGIVLAPKAASKPRKHEIQRQILSAYHDNTDAFYWDDKELWDERFRR